MAEKGEDSAKVSAVPEDEQESVGQSENVAAQSTSAKKKKDKKAKKKKAAAGTDSTDSGEAGPTVQDLQKAMAMLATADRPLPRSAPRSDREAEKREYKFWSTQPVPSLDQDTRGVNEAVYADKPIEEIRATPLSLPDGFKWDALKPDDPEQLDELYVLLRENYVEDDDGSFRFEYSKEFLKWVLLVPGYLPDWFVALRVAKNDKLVGFIAGVPLHLRVYDKQLHLAEINFLCVHKKLRSKRMAPVLIKEVTRRVNRVGLFQAVYTAGVVLPKPITKCRYYHRPLQAKKLLECNFTVLQRNMTLQRYLRLYKLQAEPPLKGIRRAEEKDIPVLKALLDPYLAKFSMAPVFSEEEVRHFLLPRDQVVYTYVVESENGEVTDFFSFYYLPSSILTPTPQNHKTLHTVYSYYNVCGKASLQELMQSALVIAYQNGIDVFNALDIMENGSVLDILKFGAGDGLLRYYMYNWVCPEMPSSQMSLVLH